MDIKQIWGKDLYKVFANYIDDGAWLTRDWVIIIENEIPKYDSNYNDNPEYAETYQRMYNTDFEESKDGLCIRPIVV